MDHWQSRTQLLIGDEGIRTLEKAHVLVAGLGGVGAYAAEMLARAGIGEMTIIDNDSIHLSNRNRQLLAIESSEGQAKTALMEERLRNINPNIKLNTLNTFLDIDTIPDVLSGFDKIDYVVDAIDTFTPKLNFIYTCMQKELKLVSSMGSGGKLNPALIQTNDIANSYGCRLAYFTRKHLHRRNIYSGFKVVFSPEPVDKTKLVITEEVMYKKSIVGTISYMPAIFGCYCASVVLQDLLIASANTSI